MPTVLAVPVLVRTAPRRQPVVLRVPSPGCEDDGDGPGDHGAESIGTIVVSRRKTKLCCFSEF